MIKLQNLVRGMEALNKAGKDNSNYLIFKNGKIRLLSTNFKEQVTIEIGDTDIEAFFRIESKIGDILKSIKLFDDENIEFRIAEDKLEIIAGKKKVFVDILEDFYDEIVIDVCDAEYKANFNNLLRCMDVLDSFRDKNSNREAIQGIHFDEDNIVALDGYKVAQLKNEDFNTKSPITMSGSIVTQILKMLKLVKKYDGEVIIGVKESMVIIEVDNVTISGLLFKGDFFNYKDVIRDSSDNKTTIDTLNLKEFHKDLKFIKSSGDMIRLVNSNLFGYMETELKTEIKSDYSVNGDDIDITFDVDLLEAMTKSLMVLSDEVSAGFDGNLNGMVFEGDKFKAFLLPKRVVYDD